MAMGIDVLRDKLTNPLRSYLFDVIIPNVIGGGDSDIMTARARSASIPERSQGAISIPYKQTAGIVVPGKLHYSHTWELTFIEGEDCKVYNALYAWQQRIVDDQSGAGEGDDKIKTTLYLNLNNTKGDDIKQIKLLGCYCHTVGALNFSHGNEETVTFNVTFSFDSFELV